MSDILVERHGRITVITLNRPAARNAMTRAMREGLKDIVAEFNSDRSQSVAIVTGAGEHAFSSGADVNEMSDEVSGGSRFPVHAWPDIGGISDSEKPVIAAINGFAVAGGFELALSCDIRIAADPAWFALTEVKLGVIAGVAANVLPRLLPIGVAMDMLLTGDRMGAAEAYRLGLVQAVVEPDRLMERAMEKAETIAANSSTAVWGTKKIVKFWRDLLLAEQQNLYAAVTHRVLLSGDVREGPLAFKEKRKPQFGTDWPKP